MDPSETAGSSPGRDKERDAPVEVHTEHETSARIGIVRFSRGRNNYLSPELLSAICDAYDELVAAGARALVLVSSARHFCAGADFSTPDPGRPDQRSSQIYDVVPRLFRSTVPVVAVIDGAVIGGGLGLALSCDFRIAGPRARLSASFARLGAGPGFGLTVTLPRLVGIQQTSALLYTGRRIDGARAAAMGLCDDYVPDGAIVEESARALAREIAASAPLAVATIRTLLRSGLADEVTNALILERELQRPLYRTRDFREGVRAAREKRFPQFHGE